MSDHQKRLSVPKSWPVERKTGTFTVKAGAGPHGEAGVPLLVLLRDVLGYVDSRKEARYALDQDAVLVNGEPVADETRPIGMFDILAFGQREEYFRVFPGEGGRLALTPIDADAAGSKLSKIEDKRQAPGGATQLNLHDGTNLHVEEGDYAAGDSIVVDNESADVVAHFPYEEGALVTAVSGRHAGEIGTVDTIEVTPGSAPNNVRVETDDGSFETVEEYVVVIDENFTGEAGPAAEPEDVTEPAAEEAGGADADAAEPDAADDTASGDEDDVAPDDEEDTPAADEEDDASTADDEEDEAPDDEEAAKADDDAETADDEDDTTANDDAAATADDEADETADDAGSDDGGDAA